MLLFALCLSFNVSLPVFWLYLELCGLCLIPLFFAGGFCDNLSSLFYYVVFSGISSSLFLLGVLIPECAFFFLGGVLMKFGVFPFWGWVYRVCCLSNWFVVWGFSTILKFSFILFPLFVVCSGLVCSSVVFLCFASCVLLSFIFWMYSNDWKICWCHMMLSSSAVLVGLGVSGCSFSSLLGVYGTYFLWASLAVWFISYLGESFVVTGGWRIFVFSSLFISLPVSLAIFYKVVVSSCIFSSGFLLLLGWGFYSFSEQLYLLLFVMGLYGGKSSEGLGRI